MLTSNVAAGPQTGDLSLSPTPTRNNILAHQHSGVPESKARAAPTSQSALSSVLRHRVLDGCDNPTTLTKLDVVLVTGEGSEGLLNLGVRSNPSSLVDSDHARKPGCTVRSSTGERGCLFGGRSSISNQSVAPVSQLNLSTAVVDHVEVGDHVAGVLGGVCPWRCAWRLISEACPSTRAA
ncbi:hypothetical protein L1887_55073 [Cichorium endivia]|nr:hypothetical protein L1887_55073 [Cichorium endivia]